ncbi:hypothetical protein CBL_08910 [Carabus blaptoides fortunei]
MLLLVADLLLVGRNLYRRRMTLQQRYSFGVQLHLSVESEIRIHERGIDPKFRSIGNWMNTGIWLTGNQPALVVINDNNTEPVRFKSSLTTPVPRVVDCLCISKHAVDESHRGQMIVNILHSIKDWHPIWIYSKH